MLCFNSLGSLAQRTVRDTSFVVQSDSSVLDSLSIVPSSFKIIPDPSDSAFRLDHMRATVHWSQSMYGKKVRITYRTFPFNWTTEVRRRDTTGAIVPFRPDVFDPFRAGPGTEGFDLFGDTRLNKNGSISRGILVGNNQNLSVNSSLNLQMSGFISDNVQVEANITDQNIPIQPDGNTQQLQDFDQVSIRFFNEAHSLTAGDYWIRSDKSYFMRYLKRGQGLLYEGGQGDSLSGWRAEAGAALSKGKFARNVIQGIEGNQGPYRLTGSNNEPFIVILSGTERVFIDGQQLQRGQEFDYVIDYNTAEITFTPKNQITKDRRIVVEFQYSDRNYARSMVNGAAHYRKGKWETGIQLISERDARNQPLLLELSDSDRVVLQEAGDDQALAFSTDSTGFEDNRIMYDQLDTVVNSITYTVLVSNPDSGAYQAIFSNVGQGNGNYIIQEYGPFGKVYQWVAPVAGQPQGSYNPVRVLPAPVKQEMVVWTGGYTDARTRLRTELAVSNLDRNTFSDLGNGDNLGYAALLDFDHKLTLNSNQGKPPVLVLGGHFENTHRDFQRIERFRAVEFERNWNILGRPIYGHQILTDAFAELRDQRNRFLRAGLESFQIPGEYNGWMPYLNGYFKDANWHFKGNGSYLLTREPDRNSDFLRHRFLGKRRIWKLNIGYRDEHEWNGTSFSGDSLGAQSYQFYDWETFIESGDSAGNTLTGGVYYRQRHEWRPQLNELQLASLARQYGIYGTYRPSASHTLKTRVGVRELEVFDTLTIGNQPESSVAMRVEYSGRVGKGWLTLNTFYENSSGLEQRREFQYLEVLPGQGVYTWIDYDEDGVKDLNEFEIAAFQDQATYIRVFVPSNDYVQVFDNQFSQTVNLRPSAVWRDVEGIRKFLARFSNTTAIRVDQKLSAGDQLASYNPFAGNVADSALIASNSSIRNSVFFNRTSGVFKMEYTYQNLRNKTLLANGFDSRFNEFHAVTVLWTIERKFTLQADIENGIRANDADYVSGRNFTINYYQVQPEITFQPGQQFRLSARGRYGEKFNRLETAEYASVGRIESQVRYNFGKRGSLDATLSYIKINYTGETNSAIAFEMLEALQPGNNFTWSASVQTNISKSLQLSLNYNGRSSENARVIHTGGVQLRAFF